MKTLTILLFLAIFASAPAFAAVKSPVDDYIHAYGLTKGEKVYVLSVDLRGDGQQEMFVTSERSHFGGTNFAWKLYVKREAGYVLAGWKADAHWAADVHGTAQIDTRYFKTGFLPEFNRIGLVTIDSQDAVEDDGTLTLLEITLDKDDSFREREVKIHTANRESASALIAKTFPNSQSDALKTYIVP